MFSGRATEIEGGGNFMLGVFRFLFFIGFLLLVTSIARAQSQLNVGRFKLVSVSLGQQAGVSLLDTHLGCTGQLATNSESNRLSFVEMAGENLHWSLSSGAEQKLADKINESKLSADQKQLIKQELNKTACGWSPVVLTSKPELKR
jgi:hypothetical protein